MLLGAAAGLWVTRPRTHRDVEPVHAGLPRQTAPAPHTRGGDQALALGIVNRLGRDGRSLQPMLIVQGVTLRDAVAWIHLNERLTDLDLRRRGADGLAPFAARPLPALVATRLQQMGLEWRKATGARPQDSRAMAALNARLWVRYVSSLPDRALCIRVDPNLRHRLIAFTSSVLPAGPATSELGPQPSTSARPRWMSSALDALSRRYHLRITRHGDVLMASGSD